MIVFLFRHLQRWIVISERMQRPLYFAEIACIFELILAAGKLANKDTILLCLGLGYVVIDLPDEAPIFLGLHAILFLLLCL